MMLLCSLLLPLIPTIHYTMILFKEAQMWFQGLAVRRRRPPSWPFVADGLGSFLDLKSPSNLLESLECQPFF